MALNIVSHLQMSFDEHVALEVVVVHAERVAHHLRHFQPAVVEDELQNREKRNDVVLKPNMGRPDMGTV